MTVGKWINKYADKSNPIYKKIYENNDWLTLKTNIDSLAGNRRRLLSVCCTLSKTNTFIFDLVGVDPVGGRQIYDLVNAEVKKGGAAILYNICDEFRDKCSAYIEAKLIDDNGNIIPVEPYKPNINFKKFTSQQPPQ
ncbi:hypothetical protein HYN59_10750 [Flavobacterium album]|uniref:Uncharacterized protein n=2 Tax=Flavobacterium album TaxID=2175091 RepID=A0A2S1QYY8_9FLAO|nr:hypothetical protein HYN59_10750 [Flavobacterium album]